MKNNIISVVWVLLLVAAGSTPGFALVTKEKKMSSRYTVRSGDKLLVDNTNGMVHVNTWNKNEVTVNITITTNAKTEEDAAAATKLVNIRQDDDVQKNHQIYYITTVAYSSEWNKGASVTIDYEINIPRDMTLFLTNKYGDVYLDDYSGRLQLVMSYGAISAKNIQGKENSLNISYGSGTVNNIENGKVDIAYTNLDIEKAGSLVLHNRFGKLNVGNVQDLQIEQKYGDLDIGTVNRLAGNVDYAGMEVDRLQGSASMGLKYCGKAVFRALGPEVKQVRIDAAYCTVSFNDMRNTNLSADIESTYGSVNYKEENWLKETERGGSTSTCRGKTGTGSGTMRVNVKYGSVKFR